MTSAHRVVDTVLIDQEMVYAPRQSNDRLLLGLKGSLNEYELDPRGELVGGGMTIGTYKVRAWDQFGRDKHIFLGAYRPEKLHTSGDWVLVLETEHSHLHPPTRTQA